MHVNLLHVYSCYYIHWYKYAHNYNNFVENIIMLGIFKKNCFILQSVHVATPSGPYYTLLFRVNALGIAIPRSCRILLYTCTMNQHDDSIFMERYKVLHIIECMFLMEIMDFKLCTIDYIVLLLIPRVILLILREPVSTSTPESIIRS